MRWLFILLLLINVIYFGWEIDKDAHFNKVDLVEAITISANTTHLKLLSELDRLPEKRLPASDSTELVTISDLKFDQPQVIASDYTELVVASDSLEPIIAIDLKPRTEIPQEYFIGNVSKVDSALVSSLSSSLEKDICYTNELVSDLEVASLLSAWFDSRILANDAALLLTDFPSQFNVTFVDCNSIAMDHSKP